MMKNLLGRLVGSLPEADRTLEAWWEPTPEGNDAAGYGVVVSGASVPEGEPCWRAVRVHHLTPEENHGSHHIYLDVLDEEGQRAYGTRLRITWDGGEDTVTIDKPPDEAGANFPLWRGQVCTVQCEGIASDLVEELSTAHPDERPGNTWFHHSFLVVYRCTTGGRQAVADSIVRGRIVNGSGLQAQLLASGGETEVARQTVTEDDAFEFSQLAAGEYRVAVEGKPLVSDLVMVDGTNHVELELLLAKEVQRRHPLIHYVLLASRTDYLMALDYLMAFKPAFGFQPDEATQAERVTIIGDVSQDVEAALRDAGCQVEHVQGDTVAVARNLSRRITDGSP